MTSLKLIFRNVRKNVKNYAIYFLTLMISVSMFYAFNSIKDQPAFTQLSSTKRIFSESLGQMTTVLSVVIAIVLGFLMVYANSFLLKRRKKELGVYTILGMEKGQIARLFAGETLCVGAISLVFGLAIGLLVSQGLGVIALKLFAIDVGKYTFVFSKSAICKTIICFVIIFLIILLFNVKSISSLKPIDLIRAERKNEVLQFNNIYLQVLLFVISIASFVVAGMIFNKYGLLPKKGNYLYHLAVCLVAMGMILLFYSSAVVILNILKSNKKLYYRKLNVFLAQQIGSKIRTNYLILAVICGILTIAICGLTAGISTAITVNELAQSATPFDLMIEDQVKISGDKDVIEYFAGRDIDFNNYAEKYTQISCYNSDIKYKDLFKNQNVKLWRMDKVIPDCEVSIISVSDFNKSLEMQGKEGIVLYDNQYAVNCNYEGTIKYISKFVNSNSPLEIGGKELTNAFDKVLQETYFMTAIGNNDRGTIIVPDSVVANLNKEANYLLVNYKPETNTEEVLNKMIPIGLEWETEGYRYTEKTVLYDTYYGMVAVVILLSIYIGLIFFIICAAILSLNQLAETADNVFRYGLLQKLGVDNKLLFHTLFKQIDIFFIAPLIPALIASLYAVSKIIKLVEDFMHLHISTNSYITIGIILVIYGGYFAVTYLACKNIVKEKHISEAV
ncbi:putative ABC transport system permease protein [Pseudobutyrivibrio sp. YE44]|uniref:ABC transporter permease n=1 Tax=Pseudobutyrivibrio sp. YE44 TaxID=1520802 RepID=UPI00088C029D|nr:ABC transporter permease [Pseudobutyrivibrio sp. YE44]SDB23625.1 putative ABC transport system permease protein [Pseudobutyrivibrio sp. YE44]